MMNYIYSFAQRLVCWWKTTVLVWKLKRLEKDPKHQELMQRVRLAMTKLQEIEKPGEQG